MKIFFDTNVYVAEALLGEAAEEILAATERASWRIFISTNVLDEIERVLTEQLECTPRFAALNRRRIVRRANLAEPGKSKHSVPGDGKDTPVLCAALEAGVDFLVTNDRHLLALDPYEGLRIVSMATYYQMLMTDGFISPSP